MSNEATITFSREKDGALRTHPDPLILKEDTRRIRLFNQMNAPIRVELGRHLVDQEPPEIAPQDAKTVTLKRDPTAGPHGLKVTLREEAETSPPESGAYRQLEGSPKIKVEGSFTIIVEGSPKIKVEGSPKIIVEGSPKNIPDA
jgi:hypothetical protein